MKIHYYLLLSISLVLLSQGCRNLLIPNSSPIITQQATPCFGSCPVYTINIYENGTVTLEAEQFLKIKGYFRSKLKQSELERLIALFDSEIFELKDQYTAQVSDMPTIYLSFNHQGRQKKIEDYYGAPESLKKLEAEVFSLVSKLKWKKSD